MKLIHAAAAALAASTLLAACSSSSGSLNANSASANTGASNGGAGSSVASKGTITLPFINDDGSSAGTSYPAEEIGANAAVDYINHDLGGMNGYQLKLDVCKDDSTPASVGVCANKAVTAHAPAVLLGTVGNDNAVVHVTSKAGVPLVAHSAFSTDVLSAKGKAFVFSSSGTSGMLVIAKTLQDKGIKKVAVIYVNVPGAVGVVQATEPGYQRAGLTVKKYAVPYPSPDLTSTFSAIAGTNAEAVVLLADPTTCTAALKAGVAVGFHKLLYGAASCQTPDFDSNVANYGAQVTLSQGNVSPTSDDADAKVFSDAMKKYGKATQDMFHAIDGFQTIMDLYAALKTIQGQPTAQALTNALSSQKLHSFMLGSDATFTCDGSALPGSPAVCSVAAGVATYSGGKIGNFVPVDPSPLTH